jgi:hypothetical protein
MCTNSHRESFAYIIHACVHVRSPPDRVAPPPPPPLMSAVALANAKAKAKGKLVPTQPSIPPPPSAVAAAGSKDTVKARAVQLANAWSCCVLVWHTYYTNESSRW